jgi:hypothetical protein
MTNELETITCPLFITRAQPNRDHHLEPFVYYLVCICCYEAYVNIAATLSVAADTRFSEPLSSNGLFRLAGIMSHYTQSVVLLG